MYMHTYVNCLTELYKHSAKNSVGVLLRNDFQRETRGKTLT